MGYGLPMLCQTIEDIGTRQPRAALAAMQYNEILARRVVAEVARSSFNGGALQPVMLHEVARRLKIDEASANCNVSGCCGALAGR